LLFYDTVGPPAGHWPAVLFVLKHQDLRAPSQRGVRWL